MRAFKFFALTFAAVKAAELQKANPEDLGLNAAPIADLDAELKSLYARNLIPGAVAMGTVKGKQVFETVAGYPTKDEIFRLFSQTKPVTAAAALMLVDEGVIKLDDPVSKFIPEFANMGVYVDSDMAGRIVTRPPKTQMTIRHLLTHTSGLVYGDGGNTQVDRLYRSRDILDLYSQDLEAFVKKVASLPLQSDPGTEWRYGVSFDVLGYVIQVASGMPFQDFMKTRVFDPLDMKDTAFWCTPDKRGRLATHYVIGPSRGRIQIPIGTYGGADFTRKPTLYSGGGGLVSTARDYLRFATMLANGGEFEGKQFLQPETVKAMLSNQIPESLLPYNLNGVIFPGSGFGFGVSVQVAYAGEANPVGESSWGGAANTNFWIVPSLNSAVVGLTQKSPFTNHVANAIKNNFYRAFPPAAPVAVGAGTVEIEAEGKELPASRLRKTH